MSSYIETPKITEPVNGAIRVTGTFKASEYIRMGRFKLSHEYTEWQISRDKNFNVICLTGESEKVLKAVTLDLSEFKKEKLYVRVRYGANGIWSDWSVPVLFTSK